MMRGDDRELGIELARRCWDNICCAQGYTWDLPNMISGWEDDSVRQFGADYYQDMIIWALPMAIQCRDLGSVREADSLVARVLRAGNALTSSR